MQLYDEVLLNACISTVRGALKTFGIYAYGDKGPREVLAQLLWGVC